MGGAGFKERQRNVRVAFAATSQCNRVISYCLTWHFEPQVILGEEKWSAGLAGNFTGKALILEISVIHTLFFLFVCLLFGFHTTNANNTFSWFTVFPYE